MKVQELVSVLFLLSAMRTGGGILRSVFTVMKGGGAYENYPFCIFHILLHIEQTYQPPPPLRIRQTHTEKRRA